MDGITKISVENVNGAIEATAWDKPYFKVRADQEGRGRARRGDASPDRDPRQEGRRRDPRRDGQPEAAPALRLPRFRQAPTRTSTTCCRSRPRPPCTSRPATAGSTANGFTGSLSGDAVNGSIELADIEGPTSASTVNGSVRLAFKGPFKKSRIETVNGSIDVAFEKASSVKYDLETVNGHIEGDFDLAVEGKFGPKQARGSYNGGAEALHCETVNGTIRLKTN